MLRAALLLVSVNLGQAGEMIVFNRDIRPILSGKCFHCHGPDENTREAKLRLDVAEAAHAKAIIPRSLAKSELWGRVNSDDEDEIMPPPETDKALTPSEIDLLKRWIEQGAEYQDHWAFIAPVRSEIGLAASAIDHFVERGLAETGFQKTKPADRSVLLRRLFLDLTGLPPTPGELAAFLEDDSPKAVERQIERLLASPRYGEHMSRFWLDAVRYGDTHGLHLDNYREFWPYRDWVIGAFNANKPWDDFIVEQLAGDLLENPTLAQRVATGFNRAHVTTAEGGSIKEEVYVRNVSDRIATFGTVMLGLTTECAACHDHKFDPISQREYYQLFAYFNSLDADPMDGNKKAHAPVIQVPGADGKENGATTLVWKELPKPKPAYILERGQYDRKSKEPVERALPAFLPPLPEGASNDRLGVARWLVADNHPLTARVAVNRFWQQFFGVGLVKTAGDFGSQGEWPSHPELLDWLAVEFLESGWDVKHLVKLIVLSKTYQRSSVASSVAYRKDPENRLLARGPRFRLDAETLRDQALAVSGLLVEKIGGPGVKPPQPDGLWKAVGYESSNTVRFVADKGPDKVHRRSLYTFWKRTSPPPQMIDAPSRESCVVRRERTNTPLHALMFMNDPQFVEAARCFAERFLDQPDEAIPDKLLSHALLRPSTPEEIKLLRQSYLGHLDHYQKHPDQAGALIAIGDTPSTSHEPARLAAWTMVASLVLNLDEFVTKN